MGVEVCPRACGPGQVPVASQGVGGDVKGLDGPGERESGPVKLGLGHNLAIEVPFAQDQEVACRVVVRGCITRDLRGAQFVDVAVAVNADVVGDVDPAQLVLVVALVLAEAAWGVAVVAEDDCFVMQCHAGDGVRPATGACRAGTPGISA